MIIMLSREIIFYAHRGLNLKYIITLFLYKHTIILNILLEFELILFFYFIIIFFIKNCTIFYTI